MDIEKYPTKFSVTERDIEQAIYDSPVEYAIADAFGISVKHVFVSRINSVRVDPSHGWDITRLLYALPQTALDSIEAWRNNKPQKPFEFETQPPLLYSKL